MSKINLTDATTLTNETSFLATLNANSALIETASDNFLSLDGTSPNSMAADLDMDSNRILNLPAPVSAEEPLRLQDLSDFTGGGTITTGAPTNASYVTLGTNATLSSERVLTAGTGISLTDAGAGSTVTVASTTTTSAALAALISDETGTGSVVFGTAPTISNPTVTTGTFSAPVLTSPTVTTKISPTTNDGAPLGDTTHNFSDLFLASGAVINWNAGDVTVTHSADTLTFAGAASGYTFDSTFGYTTGSGGTATQGTSKSTTVVISPGKYCGDITLNNAALAAGAIVGFTVTNSVVAATDNILINHVSAGTGGAYTLQVTPSSGSFGVTVRNNTAGSLSEAISLRFTIFKGATT